MCGTAFDPGLPPEIRTIIVRGNSLQTEKGLQCTEQSNDRLPHRSVTSILRGAPPPKSDPGSVLSISQRFALQMLAKQKIVRGRGPSNTNLGIFLCSFRSAGLHNQSPLLTMVKVKVVIKSLLTPWKLVGTHK